MGFLKRFFSLSSKRSKKSKRTRQEDKVDASGRVIQPEVQEGEVTRLLRSSSAHFSVGTEVDYSSLPPIPHPINNVVNTPSGTPARSATNLQRSGTYSVTVHGRTIHSCTEFPNANPPLHEESKHEVLHRDVEYFDESPVRARFDPKSVPFTPHDQSRVQRLRKDPSVASLLNMYDDKGLGREQVKRSGSTLRQLLGAPESDRANDETAMMGDISWAERFIGEHDNASSDSLASSVSLPLETPKDTYPHTLSNPQVIMDTAFTIDNSLSELSVNYPTFSSMEVELSGSTSIDTSETSALKEPKLPQIPEVRVAVPSTPHRPATEIFGFLTERKKSILEKNRQKEQQHDRDLPALPTPSVSDSSSHLKTPMSTSNFFSATPTTNSSPATTNSDTSSGQIHTATITKLTPVMNPLSRSTDTLNLLQSYTPSNTTNVYPRYPLSATPTEHRVRFDDEVDVARRDIPNQPTGSSSSSGASQPSRIPRGPRPVPIIGPSPSSRGSDLAYLQRSSSPFSFSNIQPASEAPQKQSRIPKVSTTSRSQDPFTTTSRSRPHRRTGSRNSNSGNSILSDSDSDQQKAPAAKRNGSRKAAPVVEKENSPVSSTTQPPRTPNGRAHSHSRAIFDARHPNLVNGEVPSPASSTELSPIAKDIMANLRRQKQRTTEDGDRYAYAGFQR
ncbi:unnamed protein product [Somion occarium]|uniref:Uncharacterized protein n=1 Tax=Somion occarium TaxID=3059160 RepID=A0ABP1E5T4_9APHY